MLAQGCAREPPTSSGKVFGGAGLFGFGTGAVVEAGVGGALIKSPSSLQADSASEPNSSIKVARMEPTSHSEFGYANAARCANSRAHPQKMLHCTVPQGSTISPAERSPPFQSPYD